MTVTISWVVKVQPNQVIQPNATVRVKNENNKNRYFSRVII